jgi:FkbM family methyltransferase
MMTDLFDPPYGIHAPSDLQRRLINLTRRLPNSWAGKRLAFMLRRLIMARLRLPVDIETFGQRMRLHPEDNVCEKRVLFTPQFFDPVERRVLTEIMSPGSVFVDLGANVGLYSLLASSLVGPTGRVLAVEPQPEVRRRLLFNINSNMISNIDIEACAVSDYCGEIEFGIDSKNFGESGAANTASKRLYVPCLTLETLLDRYGIHQPDAMKIDVEGAEDSILVPFFASASAERWPDLIILENGLQRWKSDCLALCQQNGYRLLERTRMNFILVHRQR